MKKPDLYSMTEEGERSHTDDMKTPGIKKDILKRICSLLVLLIFTSTCNGQNKTHQPKDSVRESKTMPVGHPKIIRTQGNHANIHCGLQDKAGNLWFGTTGEGVYRYDGKLFTQYTVKDGLSSNTIWSVVEDTAGNIWFGTDTGICRYDGKTFTSISIHGTNGSSFYSKNSVENTPSGKNDVWSMMRDRSGKLWFGTTNGVYYYNGISFTLFLDNSGIINSNGLQLKMVQCMLEDRKGNIWFGSGPLAMEGLCRYDGKSITSFKPGGAVWIRYLLEDKNGNIWLGTRHDGVWHYDGKNFSRFMEGNNSEGIGLSALIDGMGNIWFSGGEKNIGHASDGGISRYDGTSIKAITAKNGLDEYSVWCMVEDRAGNIWFGTRNTGLYRYDGKTFTNFIEE